MGQTPKQRGVELLEAMQKLLDLQENSSYVLDLTSEIVFYDKADCDGSCLLEDMKEIKPFVDKELKDTDRVKVYLNASIDLLTLQTKSHYVLNLLEEQVFYDEADCEGSCLLEEMQVELEFLREEAYPKKKTKAKKEKKHTQGM